MRVDFQHYGGGEASANVELNSLGEGIDFELIEDEINAVGVAFIGGGTAPLLRIVRAKAGEDSQRKDRLQAPRLNEALDSFSVPHCNLPMRRAACVNRGCTGEPEAGAAEDLTIRSVANLKGA